MNHKHLFLVQEMVSSASGILSVANLFVVIGSSDHALYSINVIDAKRKHVTMYNKKYVHTDWVTGCCYLPDGRVVSCAMDSKICMWSRDRRSCVDLFGHQGSISKVVSDAQFNTFFSCGYDGKILGWNLSSSSPPSLPNHQQ